MLDPVDLNVAVLCKKIYDCTCCPICDKGIGIRLRYACGHSACSDCANSPDCLLCFTNGQSSGPVVDDVLTSRAENAAILLTAYKDLFSVDVYTKLKLSEKLKIEKQLFPECIQAPFKYYNKRRSLNNSFKGKENEFHVLGEEIPSRHLNMNSKINLVKKWLADNEQIQRRPFADLHVNQQIIVAEDKTLKANKFTASNKRKKSRNLISKRKKYHDKKLNVQKKTYSKYKETNLRDEINEHMKIANQNISNPDAKQLDDEPIVIDDSPVIDKDKEAWLMVLKANENDMSFEYSEDRNDVLCDEFDKVVRKPEESYGYKVPFYKMGSLSELCRFCNQSISEKNPNLTNNNEITIVVTNSSFITTVKVFKETHSFSENVDKNSIEVQTDSMQINTITNNNAHKIKDKEILLCPKTDEVIVKNNFDEKVIVSEDLFSEERPFVSSNLNNVNRGSHCVCNRVTNKGECLVIEESDSSDSTVKVHHMEIKADIHRSCNAFDYGVLSEVRDEEEHAGKLKRPARGMTPDSSNSSEKENFHPNKPKRAKQDKKNIYKK